MARAKTLRPKATPVVEDTKKLLARIQEAVRRSGNVTISGKPIDAWDPLEFLAVAATNEALNWKDRLDAAKEVARYIHSQKKAAQEVAPPAGPLVVRLTSYGPGHKDKLIDARTGRHLGEVAQDEEFDVETE